ncbi:hypothetical protein D3C80_1471480 [compost metagenome]
MGKRQVAGLGGRQQQLVEQYLHQALVALVLGHLQVTPGEVAKDGLEDIADHQAARLLRQGCAQAAVEIDGAVDDGLRVVTAMRGVGRYPNGVLRRRQETLAGHIQVHHAVSRVVQLAPSVAVHGAVGVGNELVVAEVHRGRQLGELGDIEVFARHAVCFAGWVVWIRV